MESASSCCQAPRSFFLFDCPGTSPLNIKRATSQYVSVVIVQAIMPERMESGITIPRVQCSSVKCKMNILRREGAEIWCVFCEGASGKWRLTWYVCWNEHMWRALVTSDFPRCPIIEFFFFFFSLKELPSSPCKCFLKSCFIDLESNCFPVPPAVRKIQVLLWNANVNEFNNELLVASSVEAKIC